MTSSAPAVRIASTIASSSISPHAPSSRLSRSVAARSSGSSETTRIVWRSCPGSRSSSATPSSDGTPWSGGISPDAIPASVVLPQPGGPLTTTSSPGRDLEVEAVEEAPVPVRDLDTTELETRGRERDHAAVGDRAGAERQHLGDAVLRAAEVLPRARDVTERARELVQAPSRSGTRGGTCRS